MLPPAHDDSTAVQTVVGSNRGGWYAQNHALKGHMRTNSHCSNTGKTAGEACVSVDTLMNTVKALVEHFDSKINELAASIGPSGKATGAMTSRQSKATVTRSQSSSTLLEKI